MERSGSLKITTKFSGETFGKGFGPENLRTVYAGSEQDSVQRESRVFLLLGASNAHKSSLIDFMCNYFYGARLDSAERFKIADEKFDATTPNLSITTYVFNEATTAFRPIVIDTPGVGSPECGHDVHDLFTKWLSFNDKLRIDVIGVVLPSQTRLTSTEEDEIIKALDYIPEHMHQNRVVLVSDSDGSPLNIAILRRLGLNHCNVYKFNDSCLFEKKQDDSLKEYLRENYWKMSDKNFSSLFEQLMMLEPTTLSGEPHHEPHFGDSSPVGGGNAAPTVVSPTTTSVTEQNHQKLAVGEGVKPNGPLGGLGGLPPGAVPTRHMELPPPESPPPLGSGAKPYGPPPTRTMEIPPPEPSPGMGKGANPNGAVPARPMEMPPLPPPALPLRHADSQSSLSYSVHTETGETLTKSLTYDSSTYGTTTTETRRVTATSEPNYRGPSGPPTPPKEAKEAAKLTFGSLPPPKIYGIPLSSPYQKEKERHSPLSPITNIEDVRGSFYSTRTVNESLQRSMEGSTKSDVPFYLRSDASDSSHATIIGKHTNVPRTDNSALQSDTFHEMAEPSALSSLHLPPPPPPPPPSQQPTYSRRVEELPHGETVIEEQVVPTSHGYRSTVTKTTKLQFGNETDLNDALSSIDRYSKTSSRYDIPPLSMSKKYENIGYGQATDTQRLSEHTIVSGGVPGENSETGSSNGGGTLSPINDGTVRYTYDERTRSHLPHVVSRGSSRSSGERGNAERDTGVYAFGTLPPLPASTQGTTTHRSQTLPRTPKETCIDDLPPQPPAHSTRETVIGVQHVGGHDTEVVMRPNDLSPSFHRDTQSRLSRHRFSEPSLNDQTYSQSQQTATQMATATSARASLADSRFAAGQEGQQGWQQTVITEHRAVAGAEGVFQPHYESGVDASGQRISQQYATIEKPPAVPQHGSRYENLTMGGMQNEDMQVQMRETTGRSIRRSPADAAVDVEMSQREQMLRQTTHDVQRDSYLERMAPTVHRTRPQPAPRNGSQPSSPQENGHATLATQYEAQNTVLIPQEMRASSSPIQYRIQMGQKTTQQKEEVQKWGREIPAYHERFPDPTQRPDYSPPRHIAHPEETDTDEWDTDTAEAPRQNRNGELITTTTVTQVRRDPGTYINGTRDAKPRPAYLEGPLRPDSLRQENDPRSPMKGEFERAYPTTPAANGNRDEQTYRLLEEQPQRGREANRKKLVDKRRRACPCLGEDCCPPPSQWCPPTRNCCLCFMCLIVAPIFLIAAIITLIIAAAV